MGTFFAPDGWEAELISDPYDWHPSPEDLDLLATLVARRLLTSSGAKELSNLQSAAWVQSHGIERAFGFPPGQHQEPNERVSQCTASPKVVLTPEQVLVVDAHEHFLKNHWDGDAMMELSRRYKKRLPAERRADAERLMDLLHGGDSAEFRQVLESILSAVWDKEDWRGYLASLEES